VTEFFGEYMLTKVPNETVIHLKKCKKTSVIFIKPTKRYPIFKKEGTIKTLIKSQHLNCYTIFRNLI